SNPPTPPAPASRSPRDAGPAPHPAANPSAPATPGVPRRRWSRPGGRSPTRPRTAAPPPPGPPRATATTRSRGRFRDDVAHDREPGFGAAGERRHLITAPHLELVLILPDAQRGGEAGRPR